MGDPWNESFEVRIPRSTHHGAVLNCAPTWCQISIIKAMVRRSGRNAGLR